MQKVEIRIDLQIWHQKVFEWFQEGTNIGFGMILRPLKLATWLELLKDLEKKKKDDMVFTVLHFDFLVK